MQRLPFPGIEVFLAIARRGSLRAAAKELGLQPPAVSYQLKVLEEQIGVQLFTRTTRSTELTDAGRALLMRANPAITELQNALEEARYLGRSRKGAVRLTLPHISFEMGIEKRLVQFRELYPMIDIELSFNDAFVDIMKSGFHAGVRLGDHIHEDMIAVRLTPPMREAFFSSPKYFDRVGRPKTPKDLLQHTCIRYRYISSEQIAKWQFKGKNGVTTVETAGNLTVNNTNAVLSLARQGVGIGWLFDTAVEKDVGAGNLETVLDKYTLERPGFFLYYPRPNTKIEAFRIFVDFMKEKSD